MRSTFAILLLLSAACSACFANEKDQVAESAPGKELVNPGKKVFDRWCAACHAPGPRRPGTASLAARYGEAMPAALEERENLTPEVVRYFVRYGVLSMPPFRKTEITDAELAELGAYLSKTPKK